MPKKKIIHNRITSLPNLTETSKATKTINFDTSNKKPKFHLKIKNDSFSKKKDANNSRVQTNTNKSYACETLETSKRTPTKSSMKNLNTKSRNMTNKSSKSALEKLDTEVITPMKTKSPILNETIAPSKSPILNKRIKSPQPKSFSTDKKAKKEKETASVNLTKSKPSLKSYVGPIDLSCCVAQDSEKLSENIGNILKKNRVIFQKGLKKFQCTKDNLKFIIEVLLLKDTKLSYMKMNMLQGPQFEYNQLISKIIYGVKYK